MVWGKTEKVVLVALVLLALAIAYAGVRLASPEFNESTRPIAVDKPAGATVPPELYATATAHALGTRTPTEPSYISTDEVPVALFRDLQAMNTRLEVLFPLFERCIRTGVLNLDEYSAWFERHENIMEGLTADTADGRLNYYTVQDMRDVVDATHAKLDEIERNCR